MAFRLPNETHRLSVVGRNGTGKTQGAAWVLSKKAFTKRDIPWLIIDYKGDELLSSIPAEEIDVGGKIPKSGVVIVHPIRSDEIQERMDEWFMEIHRRENVGLFVDEGYMIGKNGRSEEFATLLTQGRSKHVPIIILSQRPVRIDPFVFSEANFIMAFDLHQPSDRKTVDEYVPGYRALSLPRYHSLWFDVAAKERTILTPVPSADEILDDFDYKLSRRKNVI